ncbi:MAG: hypothetical protein AVDCRST_MAG31-695, partial [uncultured Sphingomonas sp.]
AGDVGRGCDPRCGAACGAGAVGPGAGAGGRRSGRALRRLPRLCRPAFVRGGEDADGDGEHPPPRALHRARRPPRSQPAGSRDHRRLHPAGAGSGRRVLSIERRGLAAAAGRAACAGAGLLPRQL